MDYASTNPKDVFLFYESFEGYDPDTDMVGVDGWERDDTYGSSDHVWYVKNIDSIGRGGAFAGYQCVKCVTTKSRWLKHLLSTSSSCAIRVAIHNQSGSTGAVKVYYDCPGYEKFVMVKCVANTGFAVKTHGTSDTWYSMDTGQSFTGRYHEFIFYCHPTNGVSVYNGGGVLMFNNSSMPVKTTAYGLLDMHTINGISIGGGTTYFDFIRYYKTFSTPDAFQVV